MAHADGRRRMTEEEFEARVALSDWSRTSGGLSLWLPEGSVRARRRPTRPPALAVFVGRRTKADQILPQEPIAWPLDAPLCVFGAATDTGAGIAAATVAGEDWTQTLAPARRQANQLTPWTSDGRRYALLFRPLLPDEERLLTRRARAAGDAVSGRLTNRFRNRFKHGCGGADESGGTSPNARRSHLNHDDNETADPTR